MSSSEVAVSSSSSEMAMPSSSEASVISESAEPVSSMPAADARAAQQAPERGVDRRCRDRRAGLEGRRARVCRRLGNGCVGLCRHRFTLATGFAVITLSTFRDGPSASFGNNGILKDGKVTLSVGGASGSRNRRDRADHARRRRSGVTLPSFRMPLLPNDADGPSRKVESVITAKPSPRVNRWRHRPTHPLPRRRHTRARRPSSPARRSRHLRSTPALGSLLSGTGVGGGIDETGSADSDITLASEEDGIAISEEDDETATSDEDMTISDDEAAIELIADGDEDGAISESWALPPRTKTTSAPSDEDGTALGGETRPPSSPRGCWHGRHFLRRRHRRAWLRRRQRHLRRRLHHARHGRGRQNNRRRNRR